MSDLHFSQAPRRPHLEQLHAAPSSLSKMRLPHLSNPRPRSADVREPQSPGLLLPKGRSWGSTEPETQGTERLGDLDVQSAHPGDSGAGSEDCTLRNRLSDFIKVSGSLPQHPPDWPSTGHPRLLALGQAEAPKPAQECSKGPWRRQRPGTAPCCTHAPGRPPDLQLGKAARVATRWQSQRPYNRPGVITMPPLAGCFPVSPLIN